MMKEKNERTVVVQVCEFLWPKEVKLVQDSLSLRYHNNPHLEEVKKHPTPMFRYPIINNLEILWKILDQLDAKSIIIFASTIPSLANDDIFIDLKEWYDIHPDLAKVAEFWLGPYVIPSEPVFQQCNWKKLASPYICKMVWIERAIS